MAKLRFTDNRPFFFPKLKNYPSGLCLPNKSGNIVDVDGKELNQLLKMKNSGKPCFEIVREQSRKSEIIKEA